jgi:hypothetical protein
MIPSSYIQETNKLQKISFISLKVTILSAEIFYPDEQIDSFVRLTIGEEKV